MSLKKTLILMSDTRVPSGDITKFYNLTAYNNFMYAKQLGYDFKYVIPCSNSIERGSNIACVNPITGSLRHAAWAKILSIYRELNNYETVVYIDSDAYFNNKHCLYTRSGYSNISEPIKFLMDIPWHEKANSGFIIVDRSKEAFRFLKRWFFAEETDNKYDTEEVWEQHYVQTINDCAYTVLKINQTKLCVDTQDEIHDRWLINHVSGKIVSNQYDIIYSDVNRLWGFGWFNEVMAYIEKTHQTYLTEEVINLMESSQDKLYRYCGGKILKGPFTGVKVKPSDHWWGGDIMAKWLGTYEEPIHFALFAEIQKNHDLFINVGCGDGYYGAGVGSKNPNSRIILCDIVAECGELVSNTCELNGVTNYTFEIGSSTQSLSMYLSKAKDPWILMDVEGAEVDLLDPDKIPELATTTILVETHDFNRQKATEILLERFKKTHYIANIQDTLSRDLTSLPANIFLTDAEKTHIITENRPTRMTWLYMLPMMSVSKSQD